MKMGKSFFILNLSIKVSFQASNLQNLFLCGLNVFIMKEAC